VKVVVYLTDIHDRRKINPIRQRYFGPHRPASTLVEVSALVSPELKVEIEAQAVLP
jgi:enamine deaminase RidA (YjgF/YER057c/UK114 family)